MGVIFHIPEVYTMSINALITIWMGLILRKLKAPFLPSSKNQIQIMMKIADVQAWDVVYELWSWDGRVLRAAYQYNPSKIVWYELSPWLVWYSRLLNIYKHQTIQYHRADIFAQDLHDADVIFCFLLPQWMSKIKTDLWPRLKPGTKLISNIFTMNNASYHSKEWPVYCYIKS